jgi:hypothetical protein
MAASERRRRDREGRYRRLSTIAVEELVEELIVQKAVCVTVAGLVSTH